MIKKIFEGLLEFVKKKEIYGTIIILAVNYFLYHTICIILESRIEKFWKKKAQNHCQLNRKHFKVLDNNYNCCIFIKHIWG